MGRVAFRLLCVGGREDSAAFVGASGIIVEFRKLRHNTIWKYRNRGEIGPQSDVTQHDASLRIFSGRTLTLRRPHRFFRWSV